MRRLFALALTATLVPAAAAAQDVPATPAGREALALLTRLRSHDDERVASTAVVVARRAGRGHLPGA